MNFLYFCARCKYIVLERMPSSSCQKYEVCWRKFMAKFMAKLGGTGCHLLMPWGAE